MVEALRRELAAEAGVPEGTVRVVRSPYRFCPFGAHLDHQHGVVTGVAFDRALHLAFVPTEDGRVHLTSDRAPNAVSFSVRDVPRLAPGDWGNYPRGAALALSGHLRRGIRGLVRGDMAPGGVSSSAALGVACLLALESANDVRRSPAENVDLDQFIENDYIGLKNGILDPAVILFARRNALLRLDTRTRHTTWAPWGGDDPPVFVAVYSGVERALIDTGFNTRVDECAAAARRLLEHEGLPVPETPRLRDVPPDAFQRHRHALDATSRKRAEHYAGEMDRVARGVEAWKRGDAAAVGALLTETSHSSIHLYECGAPELIALVDVFHATPHVLGARFSGGGFRGYAVGLVPAVHAPAVAEAVARAYAAHAPEHAPRVHTHLLMSADGASIHP